MVSTESKLLQKGLDSGSRTNSAGSGSQPHDRHRQPDPPVVECGEGACRFDTGVIYPDQHPGCRAVCQVVEVVERSLVEQGQRAAGWRHRRRRR